MKHTEQQAINIAKEYKKQFTDLQNNPIRAHFNESFDVIGAKAWIVTGEFELFGDLKEFFYVISDETGEVEYTFNEHGTKNPHLWNEDESIKKEENDIDKNTVNKNEPKPDKPRGGWSVFD